MYRAGFIRRQLALALAALLALALAGVALAAYLGPDRAYTVTVVVTETVPDPSKDQWTLTGPEGTCLINHPCSQHPGTVSYIPACGWTGPADNAHCTPGFSIIETTEQQTHFHPEAQVGGAVLCAQNGLNGWCIGDGALQLSASEPLAGYQILGIEGDLDGVPFFCTASSCSLPGNPGVATSSYWALSSYGDSSQMGHSTLRIDNDLPEIVGLVQGVLGENGWFISDVDLAALGSDATSGLAAQQVQVDGGGWVNNAQTLAADGAFSVVFRAEDVAGQHSLTVPQDIGRDTTPPDLSLDAVDGKVSGTLALSGQASDATSGLAGVQFAVNGSAFSGTARLSGGDWQLDWDSTDVPNGFHELSLRALDQAGHLSTVHSIGVVVENQLPYINLPAGCPPIWQALNLDAGPGASPIELVRLTVSDEQGRSHTESFAAPPQGWTWHRYFSDGSTAEVGEYRLEVSVEDRAGNRNSRAGCISIPDPGAASLAAAGDGLGSPAAASGGSAGPLAPLGSPLPSLGIITAVQPQPALVQQLSLGTAANSVVWGDAAVALAGVATAYALGQKARREEEERRKQEAASGGPHKNNLLAAHLSDAEIWAMVPDARADMGIDEARLIVHNTLQKKGLYSPTGWELNQQVKEAAGQTQVGGGSYTVQKGDSWYSIAGEVYGNQRMAGQLAEANGGASLLHPGQVIKLPVVSSTQAANPFFSEQTWAQLLAEEMKMIQAREEEEKERDNKAEEERATAIVPDESKASGVAGAESRPNSRTQATGDETIMSKDELVDFLAGLIKLLDDVDEIAKLSHIKYTDLGNGYFSVSVPDIPTGQKLDFRTGMGIPGTRYSNLNQSALNRNVIRGGLKGSLALGAVLSIGTNFYSYGWGENSDVGIFSPQFAASTGWDIVETSAITLAAVGVGMAITAVVGAPVIVVGGIVALAGLGISYLMGPTLETWKTNAMNSWFGESGE
ncbi:MAG: LysM peptidoglycan-binding domain-containing protein [Anaerolineales bacterium]|nr:LysM peptidoglycan-binding domain-containing protein [Anaerolineales bacterium]